jgi:hypothetical protein
VQRADPGKPPVLLNSTLNDQLISELALARDFKAYSRVVQGPWQPVYVYRSCRRRLRCPGMKSRAA